MRQVKAKYYADAEREEDKIVLLDQQVNLTELDNKPKKYAPQGVDEKGKWVLVDFIIDEDKYIEYDSDSGKAKEVGEKEWDQIKVEEVYEDIQIQPSNVSVAASSLKNFLSTSTARIQPIFTTVKKKLTQNIKSLF